MTGQEQARGFKEHSYFSKFLQSNSFISAGGRQIVSPLRNAAQDAEPEPVTWKVNHVVVTTERFIGQSMDD